MTIEGQEREAAKHLILLILRRYHPHPVSASDLKAEFLALISEHGSPSAAVRALQVKERQ